MALDANFTPAQRADVTVSVGGTAVSTSFDAGHSSYLYYNGTANTAFFTFDGTAATTASKYFTPPGAIMTHGISITATAVSCIFANSGTGTITGATGEGA